MKKIILSFLFTCCLFLLSCETIPPPVNTPPKEKTSVTEVEPAPSPAKEDTSVVKKEDTSVVSVEPKDVSVPRVEDRALILPEGTSIRGSARGRILETNPKIIFKLAETNMPPTAPKTFSEVISFLESNPDVKIVLEAHTSNLGIAYPYNYNLSVARARLGKEYIVNRNIPANRIIESPLGEALPEYPRQEELRRYEFIIIENEADMNRYNDFISTIDVRKEYEYTPDTSTNTFTNVESTNN